MREQPLVSSIIRLALEAVIDLYRRQHAGGAENAETFWRPGNDHSLIFVALGTSAGTGHILMALRKHPCL